jgi:hypothetical protein
VSPSPLPPVQGRNNGTYPQDQVQWSEDRSFQTQEDTHSEPLSLACNKAGPSSTSRATSEEVVDIYGTGEAKRKRGREGYELATAADGNKRQRVDENEDERCKLGPAQVYNDRRPGLYADDSPEKGTGYRAQGTAEIATVEGGSTPHNRKDQESLRQDPPGTGYTDDALGNLVVDVDDETGDQHTSQVDMANSWKRSWNYSHVFGDDLTGEQGTSAFDAERCPGTELEAQYLRLREQDGVPWCRDTWVDEFDTF